VSRSLVLTRSADSRSGRSGRCFRSSLLGLLLALAVAAAPLAAQPRGYQPRPCGFDMNRNGIVGEPADCNVCDGVTTDPDGDGIDEDLVYVHASTGVDVPSCGAPGSPCRTINYAIKSATRSDGPGDGAEEIYCLAGTFTEGDIDPLFRGGGVPGTTLVPATGSQERAWQKSTNPVMLVGWDTDNDGQYPPYDTKETCVVDGSGTSLTHAFKLSAGSHVEIAHCTFRDFGADYGPLDTISTGFLQGTSGTDHTHVSFHDLSLLNINRGHGTYTSVIVWNHFGANYMWSEFRNMEILDFGSYLFRVAAIPRRS
jgi:hypothetical protein